MTGESLTVALVSDVFHGEDGEERLRQRLFDARSRGAALAVLPELPLDRWAPATPDARDDDAEPPGGPRHAIQSGAARAAGIGLVGGAIVRDRSGSRRNRALVFDAGGRLVATYEKLHLPHEPGFREKDHYDPGTLPPQPIDAFGMPVGVQLCSDINRPHGSQLLAAHGCEAVLAPRCTEAATFGRWRVVFRAIALTSAMYVLSVNRPRPESGVPIGGPSFAVSPDDEVLLETTDPVGIVTLERAAVARARRLYPGYLDIRTRLYADAWAAADDAGVSNRIARGRLEE